MALWVFGRRPCVPNSLKLPGGGPRLISLISGDFGGAWVNNDFGQRHDYPYNHGVIKIELKEHLTEM